MVSHTPATFGSRRCCGRGDIMVLVSHVISQDHITKGSNNMGRRLLRLITILLSLVAIGTVLVEI